MSAASQPSGATPEGVVFDCTFGWLPVGIVKGSSGLRRSACWLRVAPFWFVAES